MTYRDLVDRVKVEQLTLGPTTVSNLEVPALREADLGGDGMIGIDALVRQRLMMDFENHLIRVEDARMSDAALLRRDRRHRQRQRGQLILTQVRAAGYRSTRSSTPAPKSRSATSPFATS